MVRARSSKLHIQPRRIDGPKLVSNGCLACACARQSRRPSIGCSLSLLQLTMNFLIKDVRVLSDNRQKGRRVIYDSTEWRDGLSTPVAIVSDVFMRNGRDGSKQ